MAEIPDYLQLVFSEALKALRKKVPMPAKDWREFSGESQNWAFTVAGLTQGDLLQDILTLIDQAFAQGKSTENFVEEFEQLVSDRGWTEGRDLESSSWRTTSVACSVRAATSRYGIRMWPQLALT